MAHVVGGSAPAQEAEGDLGEFALAGATVRVRGVDPSNGTATGPTRHPPLLSRLPKRSIDVGTRP